MFFYKGVHKSWCVRGSQRPKSQEIVRLTKVHTQLYTSQQPKKKKAAWYF